MSNIEWDKIVDQIIEQVEQIRKDYIIDNNIIRDDVFEILEKYCTVIYFPLKDEKNCGFHIKKIVGEKTEDFVYINTAKTLDIQVFTVAHELGHIWNVAENVLKKLAYNEKIENDILEDITNRFAAELLMPHKMFYDLFNEYNNEINDGKNELSLDEFAKIIFMQMKAFLVPYNAVRKRLFETNIINDKTREVLKNNNDYIENSIKNYSKSQNSRLEKKTETKTISGIVELLSEIEKNSEVDKNSKIVKYKIDRIKTGLDISANINNVDKTIDKIEISLDEGRERV